MINKNRNKLKLLVSVLSTVNAQVAGGHLQDFGVEIAATASARPSSVGLYVAALLSWSLSSWTTSVRLESHYKHKINSFFLYVLKCVSQSLLVTCTNSWRRSISSASTCISASCRAAVWLPTSVGTNPTPGEEQLVVVERVFSWRRNSQLLQKKKINKARYITSRK